MQAPRTPTRPHSQEAAQSGEVPPKVLRFVREFYACARCGKIYWLGFKYRDAHAKFKAMFDGEEEEVVEVAGATDGDSAWEDGS